MENINQENIDEMVVKFSKENSKIIVYVSIFVTPIGKVIVGADNTFLYFIAFEDSLKLHNIFKCLSKATNCKFLHEKNKVLCTFEEELNKYFAGTLIQFTLPVKTFGSEFQKDWALRKRMDFDSDSRLESVWEKMQTVPYAETETFGGLANNMGRSTNCARAIGMACGANNHLLVVPCHRVVASNSNGGFSSGIERKKWLLEHEQKYK